jgi:hypothetical protein
MQSVSIFSVFPPVAVQIYVAGKVTALYMACKGPLKWKRFQNPEVFRILPLFFIFKIPLTSILKG